MHALRSVSQWHLQRSLGQHLRLKQSKSCIRSYSANTSSPQSQLSVKQDDANTNVATLTTIKGQPFSRKLFDDTLRKRLFYTPAFEIYQGQKDVETKGLFDYGPPGCALQNNIIDAFRRHFIYEEDLLEVECTTLTPTEVLKASGHVEKFSDWMCKDKKTREVLRADHVIKEALELRLKLDREARSMSPVEQEQVEDLYIDGQDQEALDRRTKRLNARLARPVKLEDGVVQIYRDLLNQLDNCTGPVLKQIVEVHAITNPSTGNAVTVPVPFNLMFPTTLGPLNTYLPSMNPQHVTTNAYLRPETAQGQFVNFAKLLNHNGGAASMPFASVSIGRSFRNEISPRGGLLRVREFLMAEIEHYVDPTSGKAHPRFDEVADMELPLLSSEAQLSDDSTPAMTSLSSAVSSSLVNNETLAYFLGRTHSFLLSLGVDPQKVRYRQHMPNELAHYASDCWDAELLTSSGWIECAGLADRAAHDLTAHSARTGRNLAVQELLSEGVTTDQYEVDIDHKALGKSLRKDSETVKAALKSLSQEDLATFAEALDTRGYFNLQVPGITQGGKHVNHLLHHNTVTLVSTMVTITKKKVKVTTREYVPGVIEPSFGIGRILYAVAEHCFWTRKGEAERAVLSFPMSVAPTKVSILPLLSSNAAKNSGFAPLVEQVRRSFKNAGILAVKVDKTGVSIGRRYARADELGTPVCITIDHRTMEDGTVTLRDRDSTEQVRGSIADVVNAVKAWVDGREDWGSITDRFEPVNTDVSQENQ